MHRWSVLAAAPLAAVLVTGAVGAQNDPGQGGEQGVGARVVLPEECRAQPRPAEELTAVLTADTELQSFTFTVPIGEEVDPDTAALINQTVRGLIACLNAGDFLRGSALATDNGARVLLGGLAAGGAEALGQTLAATPTARQEDALIRLLAVTDTVRMADGRLAAFVVINEPTRPPRGPETLLFVFTDENGEVKFDNLVGFSTLRPEAAATPAP